MNDDRIGPEYRDTGDPSWFEASLAPGGAFSGDRYIGRGRWKDRIYPTGEHAADRNPLTVGHVGLRSAMTRLHAALYPSEATAPEPVGAEAGTPNADPTIRAMVAVYDALEWIHSLNEHLRLDGRYKRATDVDPWAGEFVLGAIGARNASHHGLRRVVGRVDVQWPVYVAEGTRWVHTGQLSDHAGIDVRWVEHLPPRPEESEVDKPALTYPSQVDAFEKHLAGRDVYNTLTVCWAFFRFRVLGEPLPADMIWGPASRAPNIDPAQPATD